MTSENGSRNAGLGLLVLLALLWGGAFTLIKIGVETIPPATLAATRVTIAAAILYAIVAARGERLPRGSGMWATLFVQGALTSAIPFFLIGWGEQYLDSGVASVLNSTPPLFVFLISFVLLGATARAGEKFAGVAIGLAGVMMIMGPQSFSAFGAETGGQIAILCASLSYACAALVAKRFAGLSPLVTATGSMITASCMMLPVSLIVDQPWTLLPTGRSIVAVAVLAIFCTALAQMIYFKLLKTVGALITTSNAYLRAVLSVLFGVVFLGESLSLALVIGIGLIFTGLAIVTGHLGAWFARVRERKASA